jgi:ABC-2 type transport system ATP-binding protein
MIGELRADHAVLVSSHALADVEQTCDEVVILHHGRVLAADRPERLAARLRPAARVDVEAVAPAAALAAALAEVPGVRRVEPLDVANGHARYRVESAPDCDLRAELAACIADRGWGLLALAPVEVSLEEAFLALVSA